MPTTYVPSPAPLVDISIPSDGENIDAADVNDPFQEIADGVAFCQEAIVSLASMADLRAIDTTSLAQGSVRHVLLVGLYVYQSAGAATELEPYCIDPTTGPGRWYLSSQGGHYIGSTVLTSASANFTTGAFTRKVRIRGVGGGGAGGGCTSNGSSAGAGGGGAAGSYAEKTFTTTTGGLVFAYTCGAAGAGSSAADGGAGTDSTFDANGTTVTAKGGGGGTRGNSSSLATSEDGGTAAISTSGDVNTTGAPGAPGVLYDVANVVGAGGTGGSSPFGAGGAATLLPGNGNAASGKGGGGAGALTGASAARTGGAGTAGQWVVEEYT
jgi:hypothetical protein